MILEFSNFNLISSDIISSKYRFLRRVSIGIIIDLVNFLLRKFNKLTVEDFIFCNFTYN